MYLIGGLSVATPLHWKWKFVLTLFYFFLLMAPPEVYGSSQGRGPVRATAAGLCHSHSNVGSKLHLRPTPQLMARLDP